MDAVELARQFLFVREIGGQNRGFWVEWIQHFTGNSPGDSWCASFVSMILGIYFQGKGKSTMLTTAVVQDMYAWAKDHGWLTTTPTPGDLFLYVDENDHAHHVGFYTGDGPTGIAGNTSTDGTSSNGDRVAEHPLHPSSGSVQYVAYPRPTTTVASVTP